MWDIALAILIGKYVALNVYIHLKEKEVEKNNFIIKLKMIEENEINWRKGKETIGKKK